MAKILVIDDDVSLLRTLGATLEKQGFQVSQATSGAKGVQLARELHPDLILCDVLMEGADGRLTLYALRRDPKVGSIPFVLMSANALSGDALPGSGRGADGFLHKPFTQEKLLATIGSLLGKVQSPVDEIQAAAVVKDETRKAASMRIIKPNRAAHTYRQRLGASPAKVFPLLCPVRETEWADGWLPELVISSSGVAECDCVFITPDKPGTALWYITRHEPEKLFVEMLKILPGVTACRLSIQLSEEGGGCIADITYTHTSLGPAGDEFVAKFTAEYYQRFMQVWEKALNHFLTTGRLLPDNHAA